MSTMSIVHAHDRIGLPLCGFTKTLYPQWPYLDDEGVVIFGVPETDGELVTCPACLAELESRVGPPVTK